MGQILELNQGAHRGSGGTKLIEIYRGPGGGSNELKGKVWGLLICLVGPTEVSTEAQ